MSLTHLRPRGGVITPCAACHSLYLDTQHCLCLTTRQRIRGLLRRARLVVSAPSLWRNR